MGNNPSTSSNSGPNNSVFVVQPQPWGSRVPFQFFVIDENEYWWKRSRKLVQVTLQLSYISRRPHRGDIPRIQDCYKPVLISSHNGILLFKHNGSVEHELVLIFYNPLTRQQVAATVPSKTYIFCAFFLHTPTGEYRVLYQLRQDRTISPSPASTSRYALLGIRTRSFREIVNSSCPKHCHPDTSTPPVISNGALHWMVSTNVEEDKEYLLRTNSKGRKLPISCYEAIISFGMESEEFHVIPHPMGVDRDEDNLCATDYSYKKERHGEHMKLLEMEGKLCLCDGSYYRQKLDIWVMGDYNTKTWEKKYVVRLDKLLPLSPNPADLSVLPRVKVVCIHNRNELVFQWYPWYARKMFQWNRCYPRKKRRYPDYMVYNLEKGGRLRKLKEGPLIDRKKRDKVKSLITHTPSSENVGLETGSVLSLYEYDNGNNKVRVYDCQRHHKYKGR